MVNLRRQHPEFVKAERANFAEHGKVIVGFDDEVQGSDEETEFVEEWRGIYPDNDDDDGTDPDPCLTGGGLSRQDWLGLHYGKK